MSTPGHELPGAYPRESTGPLDTARQYLPAQEDVQAAFKNASESVRARLPAQEDVQGAFVNAGQTARAYMPAQEDVQSTITNMGQTAKTYLPAGVASYLPGSKLFSFLFSSCRG